MVQTQVRSHLHRFLSHVNPECPLCNNQSETINQLFLSAFLLQVFGDVP